MTSNEEIISIDGMLKKPSGDHESLSNRNSGNNHNGNDDNDIKTSEQTDRFPVTDDTTNVGDTEIQTTSFTHEVNIINLIYVMFLIKKEEFTFKICLRNF